MTVRQHRWTIRSREPLPYEALTTRDRWEAKRRATAYEVIDLGWQDRQFPRIDMTPPVEWDDVASSHRSWDFRLHSWDFLGPVLATADNTGEKRYLDWAIGIALDWAQRHPTIEPDRGMAWYDMAIGLRAYRLGYLVEAAARDDRVGDVDFEALLRCAELHLEALADPRFFAAHSNHGFYVAAGQSALTRRLRGLPGMGTHRDQARERVHRLIGTQFTETGVHREHSPGYHRMVGDTFQGLIEAGLVDREEFGPLLERIQGALAWFVLPDGHLAMFGDTAHKNMADSGTRAVDPALEFVVSGGERGEPPAERWKAFTDAGYFVARDRWEGGRSYLAQTAGFH